MRKSRALELGARPLLLLAVIVLTVFISAGAALAAEPAIFWVDWNTGIDANPGSATLPFKTITHACAIATDIDTIFVGPGTYTSGAGGEVFPIHVVGENLISTTGAAATILQCGASRAIVADHLTEGDAISGFTFRGPAGVAAGGGLDITLNSATGSGWPLVADNVFENNSFSGSGGGGAIKLYAGSPGQYNPLIENNVFDGNIATTGGGGAIWLAGPIEAEISGNTFQNNGAPSGGAIIAPSQAATLTLDGNRFLSNTAADFGGAVWIYQHSGDPTHTISGNSFMGNTADYGGAMLIQGAKVELFGNEAGSGANSAVQGGFCYLAEGRIEAWNNVIDANAAALQGAAWYVDGTSTLAERFDTVIHSEDAAQATFAENVPPGMAELTISNCIYWNPAIGGDIEGASSITDSCVNDTELGVPEKRNTIGDGVFYDDPLLVDYAGAPTPDLLEGSPCIDAAVAAAEDVPGTDVYGTPRPIDGDENGTAVADIGCFEYEPPGFPLEDQAAGVTFDRWVTGFSGSYSAGTYVYGRWTNTQLEARFVGNKVCWIGPKQPGYGMADVYIDGVKKATVDCYAPAASATLSSVIWESPTLTDASHTIRVRLTGAKNPDSSGNVVVIDKFALFGAAPAGAGTRLNEQGAHAAFTGTWIKSENPTYYASTYAYSRWGGTVYTAGFIGTKVAWIGPMTIDYGLANVYIDGAFKATIDCYAPTTATGWRYRIWESAVLPRGSHYIQIRPTGTKRAAATNTVVTVDALDVTP